MNKQELKDLEDRLWQAADNLRANSPLKATQYSAPLLGLIFLRFASIKYKLHETQILEEYLQSKNSRNSIKNLRFFPSRKIKIRLSSVSSYNRKYSPSHKRGNGRNREAQT